MVGVILLFFLVGDVLLSPTTTFEAVCSIAESCGSGSGNGGGQTRQQPQREYQNRPVTVTGTQTGVDDPKDTAKATETLKIKRQKEEGTYVDPNLTTADKLQQTGGGKYTMKRDSTGRIRKMKTSTYRKSLRSRARSSKK